MTAPATADSSIDCLRVNSPIKMLTHEVLHEIFTVCVDFDPESAIALSKVCKEWREISMCSTVIWRAALGRCLVMSGNLSGVIAERAGLRLYRNTTPAYELTAFHFGDSTQGGNNGTSSTIDPSVMSQCKRLDIRVITKAATTLYTSIGRYLAAIDTIMLSQHFGTLPVPQKFITEEDLDASTPWAVQALSLDRFPMPLDVPVFQALRFLSATGAAMSTNEWLDALKNMPELQYLALNRSISNGRFTSYERQQAHQAANKKTLIRLPHLQRLTVSGAETDAVYRLLRPLRHSPSCEVSLLLVLREQSDLGGGRFFELCEHLYCHLQSPLHCDSICVDWRSNEISIAVGAYSRDIADLTTVAFQLSIRLNFRTGDAGSADRRALFDDMAIGMDQFSGAKTLVVKGSPPDDMSSVSWLLISKHTEVVVIPRFTTIIFEALCQHICCNIDGTPINAGVPNRVFPQLWEVHYGVAEDIDLDAMMEQRGIKMKGICVAMAHFEQ